MANQPSIDQILYAIRKVETNDVNRKTALKGSASGYYQFVDKTWHGLTQRYGIGTQYATAISAPKEVQNAVAAAQVRDILKQSGGDVSAIPRVWYVGKNTKGTAADNTITPLMARYGNTLTPAQYAAKWMKQYNAIIGGSTPAPASPGAGSGEAPSKSSTAENFVDGAIAAIPGGSLARAGIGMAGDAAGAVGGVFSGWANAAYKIAVSGVIVAAGAGLVVLGIYSSTKGSTS